MSTNEQNSKLAAVSAEIEYLAQKVCETVWGNDNEKASVQVDAVAAVIEPVVVEREYNHRRCCEMAEARDMAVNKGLHWSGLYEQMRAERDQLAAKNLQITREWSEQVASLRLQLAAAQADKERLDWEARLALGVLANMAEERDTNGNPFKSRWPIHHEPLRKDAQFVVPRLRAAINAAQQIKE